LLAVMSACKAEERMRATLDQPALVTAKPANTAMLGAAHSRRVVVTIAAFTPPPDKMPVEIVVSASSSGGAAHELGRVAVLPYAAFGAGDTARHKTFAFAIPPELAGDALNLSVSLVPVRGGGRGASLEVGGAAIR
jgi:hypothetical protein